MKKIFLPLAIVVIVFCSGCSKIQICVDKLTGTWIISSINENGSTVPLSPGEIEWIFPECKIKKDAYCDFTCNYPLQGDAEAFKYKVDADCKTFSMHKATLTTDNDLQILELSNTKLTVKSGDVSFYQIMYFDKK